MLFIVGIPMLKAQEVTTWNKDLTPVTKDELVKSAGKEAYYAFRMPSNTKQGWCDFVNVAGGLNNLSSAYLFRIENGASGKYRLTRKSDGQQLSGNAAFAASGKDLTLTNRVPTGMNDYDTGYSNSTPFVSFDDGSNHYNCGYADFRGGTGGWSVYVTYGPFYVVTINAVDENSNTIESREVVCYNETTISAPDIYGYDLTSGGTSYKVSGSDYTWDLTYTKRTTHNVTLNITGDVTKSIVLNDVPEGTEINIASQLGVNSSFITFSPASFTGPTSDETINVTATQTLPFATDGTKYFMNMGGKYATTENTNSLQSTFLQIQNSYLWTFSGNAIDGFKLYNVGADAYAKVNNSNNSVATFVSEGDAPYFELSANSYSKGAVVGGYCLKLAGTTNCYLNDRDNKLSTWTDNRATSAYGSMFKFESVNSFILAKLNELTTMTNYVGGVQAEALVAGPFKEKLDEVTANPTVDGYNEVISQAANYKVAPVDGGYYRIVSAYSGFSQPKAVYNDGGTMKWKSYAAEDASMVLKFIKSGDKWKIYVPSADAYMAGNTGTTTTDAASAADYTFNDLNNAVLNINDGSGTDNLHANGHNNGAGADGTLINHGSGADGASAWYVIRYGNEVSEDQLIAPYQTSVNTVYQTYATSEKVIVANPGVTVYKVTGVANEKATIEEVGTSVVPASTGVILKGERGKTFTMLRVTTDVTSHYVGNVLMQGDGTAKKDHFVLAYREADTDAHFYKIGTLKIPTNRAYLPASSVNSNVAALALNFGDDDELTAIESVPAQAESAQGQAFDLQGRRVSKLQKGIYIVGGKKVMVK